MASKDSKGRDFAESIRSKVNTIRDDSSRVAKKKDVIKGQQPYLKDAIELVYGEYKASSQSKNSKGVSLLVGEGGSIDEDTAKKYGLTGSKTVTEEPAVVEKTIDIPPKVEKEKKPKAKAKPKTEDKSVKGPASA